MRESLGFLQSYRIALTSVWPLFCIAAFGVSTSINPGSRRPVRLATGNALELSGSRRKLRVPYSGVLDKKDPTIQGAILGSPVFGNPHIRAHPTQD